MTRISRLSSTGLSVLRAAVDSIQNIVRRRASEPVASEGSGARNLGEGRVFSFPLFLLGAVASLWVTTATAQSHTIYVEPVWIYSGGPYQPYYSASLSAVFANTQAQVIANSGPNWSNTVSNLRPAPNWPYNTTYDGVPSTYIYDLLSCATWLPGSPCTPDPGWDFETTVWTCPANGADHGQNYNTSSTNEVIACAVTIPVQPPPCKSKSCLGNPIYASTGQKLQVETDYAGVAGLSFARTYRSNNGSFASVTTQAFADNSSPAGTTSAGCYPAYYFYNSVGVSNCFPYISVYPYVNNGVAQYQLQTSDGRSIGFTGPNNAVTANADINERVTQLTVGGATEWQVQREDDTVEIYSSTGSLLQKTLRGGKSFTYTYSTASTPANIAPSPGLLLTQSDAFGHTLSWQYNTSSQMSQMTDPAGGIYQYSYDSGGNLTGVVYPDTLSKTYWYNESANTGGTNLPTALTGITDENAVRYATFQYNGSGLAVNTQHAGGVESYTFNYTNPGYSTTVTDPLGTVRTYGFQQNLSYNEDSSQTQPAASGGGTVTQSETYDVNGNPASATDYNGNVTTSVYDLTRNLETSRTEAYGTAQARTITTTWDPSWRQPDLITEPNRTTGFTYDALGNVLTKTITDTSVTPNVSRTWTYTYDSYGRMLSAQGPRTDVNSTTTYAYYTCTTGFQCGQVQTITDALGHITTFNTYNAHGQPLTVTDPNGVVTTLTYDARMRLTSRQIGTETTSYSYTPTGLLQTVTLPDSSTITYTYDAAHRLTDITDGLGDHIHYTLDNMGNRTAENTYDPSNTLKRTHGRVINALNEISQDVNSAGTAAVTTALSYDDNGNILNSAAPLARSTADQYDALNRLKQITDPNGGITNFGYDANDNIAAVIDPRNLTTTYTHNGFGDVTQLVSPDTGTSLSTYYSGGNLKTTTDARGATATYSYDALNRVSQVAYTDQTINFFYDVGTNGLGRLTGASDANHSMSWAYDGLGRVTGKGQTIGSVTKSVGYGYSNGDLISLVTPSGQTVVYGYTNHRITSITVNGTTILSGVTYDPFGPANAWTWGNGTTVSRTFDADGNPNQFITAGVTNGYTIDNAARITAISDGGLPSNSWTFGYDLLDRVNSGLSSAITEGYTYDANSNRLTTTGAVPSAETIATSSNQLNSTTGSIARAYSYDAAGNTQGYANNTYTFNQRSRMSQATVAGSVTNYVYNALGQLIQKSGNGGTGSLMYDEAGHLLGEYFSSGALLQETIWMGDTPVATLRPNGSGVAAIYYVHTDHLGTPRKITRPSDNGLMWRWDPDTFGSVTPNTNPAGLGAFHYNLRFPGQYYLRESGLHYNYFRDYDPQTGRYIESDPIGLQGGINTYSYAGSNPVSHYDPLGLDCTAAGNTVTCTPAGGPTVSFPRPPGWPDYIGPSVGGYHSYNEWENTAGTNKQCLENYIRNHPTPGSAPQNPASAQGAGNNATPDYLSMFGSSPVLSYLTTSNGTQVIVNVTMPGHPLFPGYVARTVQSGPTNNQLNNYGEGLAWKQSDWSPLQGFIDNAWQVANEAAYKACSCQH
jgi:RHS repeat-associated protein